MAMVTVELRHLLKTDFELFDFEYEFDDKQFAKELEQAVIDYYYFSEIGHPSPDRFKHIFKRRWLSMVGYYNQLHNTTLLEYNPLINHKMNEALDELKTSNRTEDNQTSSNSEGVTNSNSQSSGTTSNTRTDDLKTTTNTNEKTSDYPQQDIGTGDFLSGQRVVDNETENTGTVEDNSNSEVETTDQTNVEDSTTVEGSTVTEGTDNTHYEKTIEGITGMTYQDLIQKERENLIRIKQMVINELKPCFLLVYN